MSNEYQDSVREKVLKFAEEMYYLYADYLQTPQMMHCCNDEDCCGRQDWKEIEKIEKKMIALYTKQC